jgi:hypothetical protein
MVDSCSAGADSVCERRYAELLPRSPPFSAPGKQVRQIENNLQKVRLSEVTCTTQL